MSDFGFFALALSAKCGKASTQNPKSEIEHPKSKFFA